VAALSLTGCGSTTPTPALAPTTPTPVPATPSAALVPTAATTPGTESVWRVIDGFPPAGASISAISAFGSHGFVIAGSVDAAYLDCPKQREARLWLSSDGDEWQETALEKGGNATADLLPVGGDESIAIGTTGSPGCPGAGPTAWAPAGDSIWNRLPTTGLEPDADIVDVTAVHDSGTYVATGHFAEAGDMMGVWSVRVDSTGSQWQHAVTPPPAIRRATLTSLAAAGDTVVGFDVTRTEPAWYSLDAGQTWTNSGFQPSYELITTDAGSDLGGFVAAGRACCGLPGVLVGAVVRSPDGHAWTEARGGSAFAKPIEAVVSTPVGWIALGEESYLSADGDDWWIGPPLPNYEPQIHVVNGVSVPYRLAAAASDSELVVISPDRIWLASLNDLAANRWPTTAPEPDLPVVGGSYEHTLLTHCGPFDGPLNFDLRSWVPDLPEGYFPTSFDSFFEHGTLRYVAVDRLEFTGLHGDVVIYNPTDDPPPTFPCH
jgi:hypothetical protein